MPNIIAELEKEQFDSLAKNFPDFTHVDTVKVWVKVREGEKERLQA
jgi:large subunit ribosomal protein L19